jgi:hypothetical protein
MELVKILASSLVFKNTTPYDAIAATTVTVMIAIFEPHPLNHIY